MESQSQVPAAGEAPAQDPALAEDGKAPATEEGAVAPAADLGLSGGSSSTTAEEGPEKTLAHAEELFGKGSKAIEDGDFVDAVDCLSRALEIRASHYGELAQECAGSYYKYGCALLYKAQEESDPLGDFPKIPPGNEEKSKTSLCIEENGSSKASSDASKDTSLVDNDVSEERDHGKDNINKEVDEESGDDEDDTAEVDEDESDLDLAWKMLDVARAIVEKQPGDTIEKVNILSALAEVSMEREDIETSLNDYLKALSILEHLVEPDHRRIIELNFRVSLVLELGCRVSDAIPYCEKAISLCKSRLVRLKENGTNSTTQTGASGSSASDLEKGAASNVAEEIELLSGFSTELGKKLEDLQQILANPRSVISDVMKLIATKQTSNGNNAQSTSSTSSLNSATTNGCFDSPTISTAATNGVVDLGVVGRGVKRATIKPISDESSNKKPTLDKPSEEADHS